MIESAGPDEAPGQPGGFGDDLEAPRDSLLDIEQRAALRPNDRCGGHYEVVRLRSWGGFAEVYEAVDVRTGETRALKLMRGEHKKSEHAWRRMRNEARAGMVLEHDNLVRVFDVGVEPERGLLYFVMELLEGRTLLELIHFHGRIPLPLALDWFIEICEGVHALNEVGIVHRDLKPENIFVTREGRIKILDLGNIRFNRVGLRTTKGPVTGTVLYMSPEHIKGDKTDRRADVCVADPERAKRHLKTEKLAVRAAATELAPAARSRRARAVSALLVVVCLGIVVFAWLARDDSQEADPSSNSDRGAVKVERTDETMDPAIPSAPSEGTSPAAAVGPGDKSAGASEPASPAPSIAKEPTSPVEPSAKPVAKKASATAKASPPVASAGVTTPPTAAKVLPPPPNPTSFGTSLDD